MTDEQQKKITWLRRAFYAEKNAKAWLAKLERDRSFAERISRNSSGTGGTISDNSTETALIRLADTERQTQKQLHELYQIREEITAAIMQLNDTDLQAVLVWHYLNYFTFEQTAEKMHYHVATVFRKHISALNQLAIKCD